MDWSTFWGALPGSLVAIVIATANYLQNRGDRIERQERDRREHELRQAEARRVVESQRHAARTAIGADQRERKVAAYSELLRAIAEWYECGRPLASKSHGGFDREKFAETCLRARMHASRRVQLAIDCLMYEAVPGAGEPDDYGTAAGHNLMETLNEAIAADVDETYVSAD